MRSPAWLIVGASRLHREPRGPRRPGTTAPATIDDGGNDTPGGTDEDGTADDDGDTAEPSTGADDSSGGVPVDFDPAFVFEQVDAALAAGVPGLAVAVVMHGEVVLAEGFGVADESGTPRRRDDALQPRVGDEVDHRPDRAVRARRRPARARRSRTDDRAAVRPARGLRSGERERASPAHAYVRDRRLAERAVRRREHARRVVRGEPEPAAVGDAGRVLELLEPRLRARGSRRGLGVRPAVRECRATRTCSSPSA